MFVLDMGEPVLIQDLARQMIELCGFRPGEDIKIEFTGLRPGEKMYEEPIHQAENIEPTKHPKVRKLVKRDKAKNATLVSKVRDLSSRLALVGDGDLIEWLSRTVPEYTPSAPTVVSGPRLKVAAGTPEGSLISVP